MKRAVSWGRVIRRDTGVAGYDSILQSIMLIPPNPAPTIPLTKCDPYYRENLTISSLVRVPPFHRILCKSVDHFLLNPANKQPTKETECLDLCQGGYVFTLFLCLVVVVRILQPT